MAFTDDDLERLKDDLCWTEDEKLALLARLKAAEVVADPSYECTCQFIGPKEFHECEGHYNLRKAAGQ